MSMNLALIGVGHWGSNHLKVLRRLQKEGDIDRLTVCDSRPSVKEQIPSSVDFVTEIDSVLSNDEIKAVDIVTPTPTHFELGKKALEAGKDVLIEKPLSYTTEECDQLIDVAKSQNRILMTGHIFRYHPAISLLKDELDKNTLGRVHNILISREAFRVPRQDMGVLHALAIHDVDLACFLLNKDAPESIFTIAQSFYSENPDEMAVILMRFGEQQIAEIRSSWLNPVAHKTRVLTLIGSNASASIDFLEPQVLNIYNESIIERTSGEVSIQSGERTRLLADAKMPLDIEIEHFLDCVKHNREPRTNGAVGRNAVKMIEFAFQSLKSGTPVEF